MLEGYSDYNGGCLYRKRKDGLTDFQLTVFGLDGSGDRKYIAKLPTELKPSKILNNQGAGIPCCMYGLDAYHADHTSFMGFYIHENSGSGFISGLSTSTYIIGRVLYYSAPL